MGFFIDIVRLTAVFVGSIVFIIAVLRFLAKMTEPFYEWLEKITEPFYKWIWRKLKK